MSNGTWRNLMLRTVGAVLVTMFATAANACVICAPYPQKTGADYVVGSDTVVFARESTAQPFTYEPIEVLKGRYNGPIQLLLDTETSRALGSDTALAVALVQDRPGGQWTRIGAGGSDYQDVLREVAGWHLGVSRPVDRATFFAPHLRSDEDALAELAFLEVARAPYATLLGLKTDLPREDLYRGINDLFRIEWHPLYILLLGLSDQPGDIAFVRGKIEAAQRFGMTTNLAAYVTALIEMEGATAIRSIADVYIADDTHTDAELIEVLKALSVQGNSGRPELQAAAIEAYSLLLDRRPALAGYAASDLFDWRVSHLGPRMREILDAGIVTDEPSQLALTVYLGGAEASTDDAALPRSAK
jgi:hypothetical protein